MASCEKSGEERAAYDPFGISARLDWAIELVDRLDDAWPERLWGRAVPLEYAERALNLNFDRERTEAVLRVAVSLSQQGSWW